MYFIQNIVHVYKRISRYFEIASGACVYLHVHILQPRVGEIFNKKIRIHKKIRNFVRFVKLTYTFYLNIFKHY